MLIFYINQPFLVDKLNIYRIGLPEMKTETHGRMRLFYGIPAEITCKKRGKGYNTENRKGSK